MRTIPPALAEALATGATTLCRCWRLVRRDGTELGFTDHDRDLTIGGLLFEAASGFDAAASETELGLAAGGGEIAGALASARIEPRDIEAGRYDEAEIETFLVDWTDPRLDFRLERVFLGEIRSRDGQFTAETRNLSPALERVQGRRTTLQCDASLGDARCGIDLSGPPNRLPATLGAVSGERDWFVPEAGETPPGRFTGGRAEIVSGTGAGLVFAIRQHLPEGRLLLWEAPSVPVEPGDALSLVAGCDRRFATCRDRFGNARTFRGFPYLPSPDTVLAYARPGEGVHRGRPLVRP